LILVTAATKWEAEPLSRLTRVQLVRTGIGPTSARAAMEKIDLKDSGPLIVVSSGLAGALQPGIKSGDLVADVREAPIEFVQSMRATAERLRLPLHMGVFAAVDRVANAAEKRELGAKRMVAVDMESGALRDWTRARGGTFLAIRAVLDELDEEVPGDAPGDGALETLQFAARHWRKLPKLAALGLRQARAMRRLSAFLADWLASIEVRDEGR